MTAGRNRQLARKRAKERVVPKDWYTSFAALRAAEPPGEYRIRAFPRGSAKAVLAPHGGAIEPGTSEIAAAVAGEDLSLYCFEGLKGRVHSRLHITSHLFDEPECLALVAASDRVLAMHG